MQENEKARNRKRLFVAGVFFIALTAVVLALMSVAITHSSLRVTYELAQETATFLEDTCERYENLDEGYSAQSLQSLLDTAKTFERFLPSDKVGIDNKLLHEFMQAEHVGGMIVFDAAGNVVAQADLNDADSSSLWADVIASKAVQNVFSYDDVTYSDMVQRDGTMFNFVAVPYDAGVLVAYESLQKPTVDPYEYSVADLLTANTFHKNPTVIMVKDGAVVSTNDPDLATDSFDEAPTRDAAVNWKDGSLTPVPFDGSTWYALRTTFKDYRFFILYSEDEVFADRGALLALGLSAYLAVCVAILVVRGYFDKRNLRATQKQLRIINAISATYETTFLLHLDTMRMESIKMLPDVAKLFAQHPVPHDFLNCVCRDAVAPESREAVLELMDASTMEDRLRGNAFLGLDIKTNRGTWYSLQVIPQRRDADGHLLAVLVATRDVTAMKRAEELSFRDKLTGLRNRNYLESRDGELMRSGDLPVSVIMADCNYLKRTNDTLGHEWGDKLLQRVAGVLSAGVPEDCLVMRIGGDEFLLVCPHTGDEEAEQLIGGLKRDLAAASDEDLTLSVSFGACTVCDGETTFEEAFKTADDAMYAEKQQAHAADGER